MKMSSFVQEKNYCYFVHEEWIIGQTELLE